MSRDLYLTLLTWRRGRGGVLKDHGRTIVLPEVGLLLPGLPHLQVEMLDWAPFYFAEIQLAGEGQRGMEKRELAAARALLALVPRFDRL